MITVNGEQKDGFDGMLLTELLEREGYEIRRVAVEINDEIIPRAHLGEISVKEGDRIEVVSFVGGG